MCIHIDRLTKTHVYTFSQPSVMLCVPCHQCSVWLSRLAHLLLYRLKRLPAAPDLGPILTTPHALVLLLLLLSVCCCCCCCVCCLPVGLVQVLVASQPNWLIATATRWTHSHRCDSST